MANKYPYIASGGPLTQAVTQLRKSFPAVIDADLLKKLGLAPNNESYLLNVIRFLGLIQKDGKKISEKAKAFVLHKEEDFQGAFELIIKEAYSELFEIRGDDAWNADRAALITFFRQSDESTELVGQRQANTFATLAALAGKRQSVSSAPSEKTRSEQAKRKPAKRAGNASSQSNLSDSAGVPADAGAPKPIPTPMALTVRVEINLPSQGDQETYDRIFRSLRQNLLNA